jgi:hypothetical protein
LRFTNYTFALVDFDHHTAGKNEVLEMSDRLRLENSELEDKIEQLQHVRQQEEETVTKVLYSYSDCMYILSAVVTFLLQTHS